MSTATIFVIGAIVFAITVYGVVMSGGVLLSEMADNVNDNGRDDPGDATP
jgi:hypothetical protein